MQPYVQNAWYMAGWEEEVPTGGFLSRTLIDRHWLMMRLEAGGYAMLADRCPHRFVPLSMGRREGDTIRCGYHGLGFDPTGRCVHNPFGGEPPRASVPTMPVVAAHSALWFWPGDAERADPARIPDFAFVEGPQHVRGHLTMRANYEFVTDNLMDLSHAEFIHGESFGVNGALLSHGAQQVVTDESGAVWNNWDITDAVPPAWAEPMLPAGERIDQWLHMRWHAPASMALHIGLARAGTDRGAMIVPPMANPHIITPETQNSSHYFYTREPGQQAEDMVRRVFEEEDEPMIEAAQAGFGGEDFWQARPLVLPADAGAIRARRRLQQLRREEAFV